MFTAQFFFAHIRKTAMMRINSCSGKEIRTMKQAGCSCIYVIDRQVTFPLGMMQYGLVLIT